MEFLRNRLVGTHFPPIRAALTGAGRRTPARAFHLDMKLHDKHDIARQTTSTMDKNKMKNLNSKNKINGLGRGLNPGPPAGNSLCESEWELRVSSPKQESYH